MALTKPSDIYKSKDKGKTLGREARSGVESRIGKIAETLDFNVDRERDARSASIDQQADEALQKISRNFSLTPGGTRQGRAITRASAVEAQRLGSKANLESELSQRKGAESRANIQALQSIQEQLDRGDITEEQAKLAREQFETGAGFEQQRVDQEGRRIGIEERRTDLEAQRIGQEGRRVDIEESRQLSDQRLQLEQLELQRSELDLRAKEGDRDAELRRDQLDAEIENTRRSIDIEEKKLEEARESRIAEYGYRNKVLGQQSYEFDRNYTMQREQFSQTYGLNEAQFEEAKRRSLSDEDFRNTELGQRMREFQSSMDMELMKHHDNNANELKRIAQDDARLAETGRQFDQNLEARKDEIAKQFNLSKDQLTEAIEARKAGNEIEEERMKIAVEQYNKSHAEEIRQFDSNIEFTKERAKAEDVFKKADLKGEIDGQATLQKLRDLHSRKLEAAQVFADPPPVVLAQDQILQRAQAISEAVGEGEAGIGVNHPLYEEGMDLDSDGYISQAELYEVGNNTTDAGNGILIYTPRGRSTVLKETLDLDEKKFDEGIAMSKEQLKANKEQWMSAFEGKQMKLDENGQAFVARVWDGATNSWRESTSTDREQFEFEMQQIEERTSTAGVDMASRIGLVPEDDGVAIQSFISDIGADGKSGNDMLIAPLFLSNPDVANALSEGERYKMLFNPETADWDNALRVYAASRLDPMDRSQENVRKQMATISREMIIAALPDEQKSAFYDTVATAVFGAQFTPQPSQNSGGGLAGFLGTAAGIAGAFI